MFKNTNSVKLCQKSVFAKLSGCQKWGFRKETCIFCLSFHVAARETEKQLNGKRPNNPMKLVFLKVAIQQWEAWKQCIFSKNCLIVRKGEKTHFCAHYLFWPKIFSGPKQWKTIKIVVSAEIAQTQKWHPCFRKRCFLTWVKKWVLLTAFFEKLCSSENTVFIVFSANSSCNKKLYVENSNFMKNSGLFFEHDKKVFLFFCFQALMLLWFVFVCLVRLQKHKECFFSQFWGFWGWLMLVSLGLEGLGVFVFLVFVFLLFRSCFCLFALFLFYCWIVFGVVLV